MNLLLEIGDNSVQVAIFAIVTIFDKDTVKYEVVAEKPKASAKRSKGQPKKKGESEKTKEA